MVRTKRSATAFAFGCPHRRLHCPNVLAAEDPVEGAAVFAVAVADQEASAFVGEVGAVVARLLGDPGAGGILVQPASHTRRLACTMKKST